MFEPACLLHVIMSMLLVYFYTFRGGARVFVRSAGGGGGGGDSDTFLFRTSKKKIGKLS